MFPWCLQPEVLLRYYNQSQIRTKHWPRGELEPDGIANSDGMRDGHAFSPNQSVTGTAPHRPPLGPSPAILDTTHRSPGPQPRPRAPAHLPCLQPLPCTSSTSISPRNNSSLRPLVQTSSQRHDRLLRCRRGVRRSGGISSGASPSLPLHPVFYVSLCSPAMK